MILTLKTTTKLLFAVALLAVTPLSLWAQESLTLSVSPTIFEMTANPEQKWESTVRVINGNPYDITVYANVVNFAPQGEGGQGKFLPVNAEESGGQTLAEWMQLDFEEITIPAEQTIAVPFTITVPTGAPPGGHFAAVLIGTKMPEDKRDSMQVETSQVVTSLIFLRVTGDIKEEGTIRSFRSLHYLAERPEMSFELRFENKGNVHVLPQGEIKILNMWNQERGVIPVNRQTMFGNVLPNQIRKYTFSWSGDWSLADIGRYRAVATLAYGLDGRQFASSETAFWVVPWKIATVVLFIIFGFISLVTWAIKVYIRKMLAMAGVSPTGSGVSSYPVRREATKVSVVAPIEEGILDLRNRFATSESWSEKASSITTFISQYKLFFLVTLAVLLFLGAAGWYVKNASVDERGYEITIEGNGQDVVISSEQVEYDTRKESEPVTDEVIEARVVPPLHIINRSGVSGLAAELGIILEAQGYEIAELSSDFGVSEQNTVIVYHPDYVTEALELSKLINGALLSAFADAQPDEPITVYVGQDYQDGV